MDEKRPYSWSEDFTVAIQACAVFVGAAAARENRTGKFTYTRDETRPCSSCESLTCAALEGCTANLNHHISPSLVLGNWDHHQVMSSYQSFIRNIDQQTILFFLDINPKSKASISR